MTVRFSNQLVADLIQPFWAAWQAGEFMTDASAVAGTHRQRGLAWVRQAGGVRPRRGADCRGDTCPSVSEKRSRWVVPAASRSAPSRGALEGRRRRSAESWGVTVTGKAPTGPRPRIRWPMSGQGDPSRPSW